MMQGQEIALWAKIAVVVAVLLAYPVCILGDRTDIKNPRLFWFWAILFTTVVILGLIFWLIS